MRKKQSVPVFWATLYNRRKEVCHIWTRDGLYNTLQSATT